MLFSYVGGGKGVIIHTNNVDGNIIRVGVKSGGLGAISNCLLIEEYNGVSKSHMQTSRFVKKIILEHKTVLLVDCHCTTYVPKIQTLFRIIFGITDLNIN